MATNPRGHTVPSAPETPSRAAIFGSLLTIGDIVRVANTTARSQLVADLTAAGVGPSAARPLYVHRTDAATGRELEVTVDGSTWRAVASRPAGAAPYLRLTSPSAVSRVGASWSQVTNLTTAAESAGDQPWTHTGGAVTISDTALYSISATISVSSTAIGFGLEIYNVTRTERYAYQGGSVTGGVNSASVAATRRITGGDVVILRVNPASTLNVNQHNILAPVTLTVTQVSG